MNPGDLLCDIQTDKAVVSMDIEEEGILAKILVILTLSVIQLGVLSLSLSYIFQYLSKFIIDLDFENKFKCMLNFNLYCVCLRVCRGWGEWVYANSLH